MSLRVLVFQFGDLRQALNDFSSDGEETFRSQRATVEFMKNLSKRGEVLTVTASATYPQMEFAPGLHVAGVSYSALTRDSALQIIDEFKPTHIILRVANRQILKAARMRGVPVLPWFDNSFGGSGLRRVLRRLLVHRDLVRAGVPCLANHGIAISRLSALRLLWPRSKSVPWHYDMLSSQSTPKREVPDPERPKLFYAGEINDDKGVRESIVAIRILKDRGVQAEIQLAGRGEIEPMQALAQELGVAEQVQFLGVIPNREVLKQMRAADIVMVTSRSQSFEGLPHTLYEALAVQSPLIVPDHKALLDLLSHGEECLIFEAGNPISLADSVAMLCASPRLYQRISENSHRAAEKLNIGMPWHELLNHFLNDPRNEGRWVEEYSLNALG